MGTSLNDIYTELFFKVTEDDIDAQEYYLSMIADQRRIPVSYLLQLGVLFIPNNDYITHYLGNQVLQSNAGLYYNGVCPWVMFATIPIRNLAGEIVGIVGWDAYNKYRELTEDAVGLVTYKVSAKAIFQRDKYFLSDIECLKAQFDKRVVFVTDGVFDALSLCYRGIPAIALLGSSFSKEVIYYLSWYKHVYVCTDNDAAGVKLYERLSRAGHNIFRLMQNKTKDIEELLRSDDDKFITNQLINLVNHPISADVRLKVR